jgi:hypothetical protein
LIGGFLIILFSLQQKAKYSTTNHSQRRWYRNLTTMQQPNYEQKPFFSVSFRASIAIGSYFSFDVGCGKRRVGRILEARKAAADDHIVQVNLFLPFAQWDLRNRYLPIGEGIGQGLHEIILTTEISEFLFDRDVEEVAFVFTPEQLEEYGAVLQGIDNAFVCRFNQKGFQKVVTKALSPAFPSKHADLLCPVTQCYTSKVFHDMENLRNQIYSDLNRVSELQGDVNRTFNRIPFSSESWDYLVLKLCGGLGLTLHLYDERTSKYRIRHDMYRTKFCSTQTVELVRIGDAASLDSLRSTLGETIAYGIRAKRATKKRKLIKLRENTALNVVQVEDDAAHVFKRVLPATVGGFDFIYNRLGSLEVRTRYEKIFFHTETETGSPLEDIPDHLRELLTEQQWGYWHAPGPEDSNPLAAIKVDCLFDFAGHSYQVVVVEDNLVRAVRFGARNRIPVVFHNMNEVAAAIALKNAVEEDSLD